MKGRRDQKKKRMEKTEYEVREKRERNLERMMHEEGT